MSHHPGLGRWVAPDIRNLDYPYRAVLRRKSVLHAANGPILDQDGVGACGGFTATDTLNTAKFAKSRRRGSHSGRYLGNASGFGFYHDATMLDEWPQGWPPEDTGTSVTACAKALQKSGYIDLYLWPHSFADVLAALERQPIMVGSLWTSGMDDPDASGLIRPTGDLVGGHAFMGFGLNYATRRIRFRNHWTRDWGSLGDFYIGLDDFEWLFNEQGEVVVPIPVEV